MSNTDCHNSIVINMERCSKHQTMHRQGTVCDLCNAEEFAATLTQTGEKPQLISLGADHRGDMCFGWRDGGGA